MHQLVIVGAGQAACSLCEKLRADGFDGKIAVIGDEPHMPYQRPPLSKGYLLGKVGVDDLLIRPQTFYEKADVRLQLGKAVTQLRREAKGVTLEGGESLAYDTLVLATGSSPRQWPAHLGGDLRCVFTIRRISDIDVLRQHMKPGSRMVVLGGGYIGLEAASVARQCGLSVTLFEMSERILGRVTSARTADAIRALHKANDIDIREGVEIERLEGEDDRLVAVQLKSGERVEADIAVVGIGAVPNAALAEEAGLTVDSGLCVDPFGRTSDPDIWAIGDCACFPQGDRILRLESVGHAIAHAETIAANILGASRPYTPKPWFWSDQFNSKLQIAGLSQPGDEVIKRTSNRGTHSFWYFREGCLVAVDALDDTIAYMTGKRLIESGISPDQLEVADADFELKALLKRI